MKNKEELKRMIREEIRRESKRKFWGRLQVLLGILLVLNVILIPAILHYFVEIEGNSYFLGALTTGILLILFLCSVAGGMSYEEE